MYSNWVFTNMFTYEVKLQRITLEITLKERKSQWICYSYLLYQGCFTNDVLGMNKGPYPRYGLIQKQPNIMILFIRFYRGMNDTKLWTCNSRAFSVNVCNVA